MKKNKLTLIFTLVMGLCLMGTVKTAKAETLLGDYLADMDIAVDISASLDVYDKYIWRGFRLDGDLSLQPAFTIGVAGFEAGFWGSWDLQSRDSLSSDEVDGWIGYGFDLGFLDEEYGEKVSVSVGHTWYDFPESSLYSKEFYLGIALDTILSPSFTWYHDYEDEENGGADGNYYMFAVGHSFTLSEDYGITLDLGQEIGLNDEAFIVGDGGYSLTTVGLTIPLTEKVTMAPMFGYSAPFGDLEDSNDGNQDDEFYGGVSFAFAM